MKNTSLFPDYAVLEVGRNEAQAMRLAQQLREVDLEVLATSVERRNVIARLRREGVSDAMGLILLTEADVMGWYNVGPVFLDVVTALRDEIVASPERVVAQWRDKVRLYVLPDDLLTAHSDDDFFGMPMESGDKSVREDVGDNAILLLERCLVAAVEMMAQRSDEAPVLRRYFLEGAAVESIVASERLTSSASLYRIVDKHFCQPLLKGYPVRGIQFSREILKDVHRLSRELVYKRADVLDVLERMLPQRFLHVLGLTLLRRTTAETVWMADYIVREGGVQRSRRTQRDLFSSLQLRVVGAKESVVRRGIQRPASASASDGGRAKEKGSAVDVNFLRVLLRDHPCIEADRKGYRLVSERLAYDSVRLARIVYDAHGPISIADILARYEQRYLERPRTVSISKVRIHFPQIHSVRRGVWEWR